MSQSYLRPLANPQCAPLCEPSGGGALDGPGPRHGPGAGLEDGLDPAVRREAGRGGGKGPARTSANSSLRASQGRAALPFQGDRGVGEAQRRELELRAVGEERGAVHEARERKGRREGGAALSPGQLASAIGRGELPRRRGSLTGPCVRATILYYITLYYIILYFHTSRGELRRPPGVHRFRLAAKAANARGSG